MNINRYNYEEYFILYADNELPADERATVEEFVQANPDLEEELAMLQQLKLVPDKTILFEGKELLLKEDTGSFINLSNYKEYLLLYIDNELSTEQKHQVEAFAVQHPQVQNELALLRLTKMPVEEAIVFPDKKLLYRKEKDERVFRIAWLRITAAAVIIFAIGTSTFLVVNKQINPEKDVAVVNKKEANKAAESSSKKNIEQVKQPVNKTGRQSLASASTADKLKKANWPVIIKQQYKPAYLPQENKKDVAVENIASDTNNDVAAVPVEVINTPVNTMHTASAENNNPKHIINTSSVTTEIPDTYDIAEASNKKLRGFFRKATRILERTTNINAADEDNKLLVGAFAINLK